jgi:hypothetical protein
MTIEADVFRRMAVETSSESSDDFLKNFPGYINRFTDFVNNHPFFTFLVLLFVLFFIGAIIDRVKSGKWFYQRSSGKN